MGTVLVTIDSLELATIPVVLPQSMRLTTIELSALLGGMDGGATLNLQTE